MKTDLGRKKKPRDDQTQESANKHKGIISMGGGEHFSLDSLSD
jgi:hypothetical protein